MAEQEFDDFLEELNSDPSISQLSKNYVLLLNEYAQSKGKKLNYQLISQTGDTHQPT